MVVGYWWIWEGLPVLEEEWFVWADRDRKGRWVVKKGRRQGALAQIMQAESSISLGCVLVDGSRVMGDREGKGESLRPDYYALESVGYICIAYADPGYDAEEAD